MDLFTNPSTVSTPFVRESETSRLAAEAIKPNAGTLRAMVYDYIKSRGESGATDAEMQDALDMRPQTQTPRRIELLQAGLIKNSGAHRPTPRGRKASVWVAANVFEMRPV